MAGDLQGVRGRHARIEAALAALDGAAKTGAAPPDDNPVFVCAIGWRSGSTLVQRILMTDPEMFVWGEPLDRLAIVGRLAGIVEGVGPDWPPADHWVDGWSEIDRTGGWIANLSPDAGDFKAGLRALLDAWLAQPTRREGFSRWGAKEVRWSGVEARLLRWLYPSARFLVIARHPVSAYAGLRKLGLDPSAQGYWVQWPERHLSDLEGYAAYWNELAFSWSLAAGPLGAIVLRYEDLTAGRVDFDALGQRLGLRLNPAIALAVRAGATPDPTPATPEQAARMNALTAEGRAAFGYGE